MSDQETVLSNGHSTVIIEGPASADELAFGNQVFEAASDEQAIFGDDGDVPALVAADEDLMASDEQAIFGDDAPALVRGSIFDSPWLGVLNENEAQGATALGGTLFEPNWHPAVNADVEETVQDMLRGEAGAVQEARAQDPVVEDDLVEKIRNWGNPQRAHYTQASPGDPYVYPNGRVAFLGPGQSVAEQLAAVAASLSQTAAQLAGIATSLAQAAPPPPPRLTEDEIREWGAEWSPTPLDMTSNADVHDGPGAETLAVMLADYVEPRLSKMVVDGAPTIEQMIATIEQMGWPVEVLGHAAEQAEACWDVISARYPTSPAATRKGRKLLLEWAAKRRRKSPPIAEFFADWFAPQLHLVAVGSWSTEQVVDHIFGLGYSEERLLGLVDRAEPLWTILRSRWPELPATTDEGRQKFEQIMEQLKQRLV